jgi:Peptidase family S41
MFTYISWRVPRSLNRNRTLTARHRCRNGRVTRSVLLLTAFIAALPAASTTASPSTRQCPLVTPKALHLPAARFEEGPTITQADLVSDFDAWMSGMRALNPDISIRADLRAVDKQAALIRRSLAGPMTRRRAWKQFARLNPYLKDGHSGIYMPDYRDALDAHVMAGGRIVPVEVRFAADQSLRVFAVTPGASGIAPGDRLLSINGHSAKELIAAMLERSPGDTPAFQRAYVERRFAALYWFLYGDTHQYDLAAESLQSGCHLQVRLAGAAILPEALQPSPKAQDLFGWRILPGDIGYLRVDAFDGREGDALANIAKTAFTEFKQRGIHALVIDVRENGGGDDPLWQQDLMEYITDKPYAQLSRYVQRVTKENADPGDVVGNVKRGEYTDRFKPKPEEPIRFTGPVYILAGPFSYSATIQFIVAAQDFGIAKIAGEETAALSCQTGQVRRIEQAKTGLGAFTPITAYTRPSGQGCERGVIPDVPITINEVTPDETVDSLVSWIRTHQSTE